MERVTWGTVRMASGITEEGRNFKWYSLWSSVARNESREVPEGQGQNKGFLSFAQQRAHPHPLSYLGGTGTKSDSR